MRAVLTLFLRSSPCNYTYQRTAIKFVCSVNKQNLELIKIIKKIYTHLQDFSYPNSFVIVFVTYGRGERLIEVLEKEEEVVNQHDQ